MPTVSTLISSSGGYAPSLHYIGSLSSFTTEALVYDVYTGSTGPNRTLTYQNNVWSDSGTDAPVLKDSNGNTITQTPSNPQSFVIDWYGQDSTVVNPYYTSGSGGGTSTEDVLVENASMVFYAGVTGWRFEQRGYAAGAYSLVGGTVNESWTVLNGSNNLQHHISQIPAGGTYYLYSGSNLAATLSTTTDNKKVFCNFW